MFTFFDYINRREVISIKHFVIKGHRAALKEFKIDPQERVIVVDRTGAIKCLTFGYWATVLPATITRIDTIARMLYKVRSCDLTETMVKNTAIKLLKGEL